MVGSDCPKLVQSLSLIVRSVVRTIEQEPSRLLILMLPLVISANVNITRYHCVISSMVLMTQLSFLDIARFLIFEL